MAFMIGSFVGGMGEGFAKGWNFAKQAQQDVADYNMARDADKAAAEKKAAAGGAEPKVIDTGAKPPSATTGTSTPEYKPGDPENDKLPPAPAPGQPVNVPKLRAGLTPKSPIAMQPQGISTTPEFEGPPEAARPGDTYAGPPDPRRPPDRPEFAGPPEAARPGPTYAGPPEPLRPGDTYAGPPEPPRPFGALPPPNAATDASAGFARLSPYMGGYQTAPEGNYQALDLGGHQVAPEGTVGQNLIGGQPRPRVQWRGQGGRATPYAGAVAPPSSQFGGYGPYGPQYAAPQTAFNRGAIPPAMQAPGRTPRPPRQPFVDALGNPIQYDTDGNPVSYY